MGCLPQEGSGSTPSDVDGSTCLAAANLEQDGQEYRYRNTRLCGGETAAGALRTAELDPGDSDEPGQRRVTLADYEDCDDFLYLSSEARS